MDRRSVLRTPRDDEDGGFEPSVAMTLVSEFFTGNVTRMRF
jgi:hypothetical protein